MKVFLPVFISLKIKEDNRWAEVFGDNFNHFKNSFDNHTLIYKIGDILIYKKDNNFAFGFPMVYITDAYINQDDQIINSATSIEKKIIVEITTNDFNVEDNDILKKNDIIDKLNTLNTEKIIGIGINGYIACENISFMDNNAELYIKSF